MLGYVHDRANIDNDILYRAEELTYEMFEPYMSGSKVKTIDELDMPLNTSPGWPFKKWAVDKGDVLRKRPDLIERFWNNPFSEHIWYCFGKLEIKPREKLYKTRLIQACSAQLAFLGARLYEDMNSKFVEHYFRLPSAVGMSKYHLGWHNIMSQFEGPVDEADAKQWDSSLNVRIFRSIYRIRWRLLAKEYQTPENYQRHMAHLHHLCDSLVKLSDGTLVNVIGGQKSGSINTTSDNSFGNVLCQNYAGLKSGMTVNQIYEQRRRVYGDDMLTERMTPGYWDAYTDCGIVLGTCKQHDSIVGANFLSNTVGKNGRYFTFKPDVFKVLFSCITTDVRPTKMMAYERILALVSDAWCTTINDTLLEILNSIADDVGRPRYSRAIMNRLVYGEETVAVPFPYLN
nr:MAG: RNA-dependent RNA polymerase [Riboviria sp.]